ncbi:MAG: hypothetical protein ABIE70_12190 [bacterium]
MAEQLGCKLTMEEADINGTGSGPDIADLNSLVNYMFNGGPPPVCSQKGCHRARMIALSLASHYTSAG